MPPQTPGDEPLPKVIGYVRSGKIPDQACHEDKERQLLQIYATAKDRFEVVDLIVEQGFDEGIKAMRPGLRSLFDRLLMHPGVGLIVTDLGRIARDPRDFWRIYRSYFAGDGGIRLISIEETIDTEWFTEEFHRLLKEFAKVGVDEARELCQPPEDVEVVGRPIRAMTYLSCEAAETFCPFTDETEVKVIMSLDNHGGRADDIVDICLSPADAEQLANDLLTCNEIINEGFLQVEDEKLKPEDEIFTSDEPKSDESSEDS